MLHSFTNPSFFLLWLWFISAPVFADLVLIDDNDSQVVYSPSTSWHFGPTCDICSAKPPGSTTDIYQGSWHDGSHWHGDPTMSATVSFKGTAVYVYGIKGHGDSFSATDLTFQIDGNTVGTFSQPDIDGQGWEYHFQFFKAENLSPTTHTLTILNGVNNKAAISLLLLDYIAYQPVQDTTTTTTQGSNIASGKGGTTTVATTATTTATTTLRNSNTSTTTTKSTTATTANSNSSTPLFPSTPGGNSQTTVTATVDNPSSSDSVAGDLDSAGTGGGNHTAAIIGGVVGAVVFILIILVLLFLWMRRSRKGSGASWHEGPPPTATETGTTRPSLLARLTGRNDAPVVPFTAIAPEAPPASQQDSTSTPTTVSALTNPHLFNNLNLQQGAGAYKPTPTETTATGTFLSLATHNLGYGGAAAADKEPDALSPAENAAAHSRAIDTAITLAEEVRRLREENDRLREAAVDISPTTDDEVPPPYLRNSSRAGSGIFSRFTSTIS